MRYSPSHPRKGFTLAELLISTILMAIVLTGAYTMFNTVILHWRSGSANEATYRDARLIFTLLERDLGGIPTDKDSYDARDFFLGEEDSIEFLTVIEPLPSEEMNTPRLMRVVYRLKKHHLIREEAALESPLPVADSETGRFDRDLMEFGRSEELIIATGVLSFNLLYLWTPEEEDETNDLFQISETEYRLSNGIEVSLQLFDPSKTDTSHATEFTKTIRLYGLASERPEDAVPVTEAGH